MNYRYWVIRFVPDVARGEFTNVGLVCGRDDGDWAVRFDPRGLRGHGNFSPDLRELSSWMTWFRRTIERHAKVGLGEQPVSGAWITQLSSRQANSVQFSEPSPVDAASAAAGVDLLFPILVERERPGRRRRNLTRQSLRTDVREALTSAHDLVLGRDLFVQPRARVGKQRGGFDLAHRDGPLSALTNVWAFNVATLDVLGREIQSWNYLVSRFRTGGAAVELTKSRTEMLPSDAPISVVYDPPSLDRDSQLRVDIFEAAREAWRLNDIETCTIEEFHGRVAGSASARIRAARVTIDGMAASMLDRALYSYADVDRLVGLRSGTARRWLEGYSRASRFYEPVLREERTGSDSVTWGEMVEARMLAEFRSRDVPVQRLRPAIVLLRQEFGPYPLAHARPLLDIAGRELVRVVQERVGLERKLQLVVVRSGQLVLTDPAERFQAAARYGADGVVAMLRPDGRTPDVLMDPRRSFGQPAIRNVRTEALAEDYRAGTGRDDLSDLYDLTPDEVDAALRFELITSSERAA